MINDILFFGTGTIFGFLILSLMEMSARGRKEAEDEAVDRGNRDDNQLSLSDIQDL